ncbi:MAG: DHH family phosphoesterase, partial [Paracoccaceae bacterium]
MDYLGVSQSLSEKRWIGPENAVDLAAQALMQNTELPLAMCFVLARLGIPSDDVETYLDPLIKSLLPDPRGVLDMRKAAERILRAIADNDRIAVFADYDVDGASSAALLLTWLKAMGRTATLYVPDRIDEGYGPNEPAMRQLAENHELIICVDCGTLSHAPIAAARPADVIVLDHHLAAETLPDCVAVVNPNRQ